MIAKSVLHLHDLLSPERVDLAAEQLESGLGVVFRGTWFLVDAGRLWCNAIYQGPGRTDPTDAVVGDLIAGSRETLRELRVAHAAIDSVARAYPVAFAVVDDYGQGVAPLACSVDDRIVFGLEAARQWRR